MIYQSITDHSWKNIFVVVGVYLITLLIALFLYGLRIWTNRKTLAEIPKAWVPIDRPDVALKVHENIRDKLVRNAVISQQSKPRDCVLEERGRLDPYLTIPRTGMPPWGHVEHPGWTSPSCTDLPSCEFWTVIVELPFVLEARAGSLVLDVLERSVEFPVNGEGSESRGFLPSASSGTPNDHLIKLVARPKSMSLRSYVNHIARLGMLKTPELGRAFVRAYEKARFFQVALTEDDFRCLMSTFARLLRELTPPVILGNLLDVSVGQSISQISYLSYAESGNQIPKETDTTADKGKAPIPSIESLQGNSRKVNKKPSSDESSKSRFVLNSNSNQLPGSSLPAPSPNGPINELSQLLTPFERSDHSQILMQSVVTAIRVNDGSMQSVMSREPSVTALNVLERLEN
ncbi:hypothetical protein KEM56_003111 [Ascosphaera pollenicola]|nr:hypothetical protein KEM56_003111 [Ascosphaera pollenicola]